MTFFNLGIYYEKEFVDEDGCLFSKTQHVSVLLLELRHSLSETDIVLLNLENPSVKIFRRFPLKTKPNFVYFFHFKIVYNHLI